MRRKLVYKVVFKKDDAGYFSTNTSRDAPWSPLPACITLKYTVGEKTVPCAGKLFVFVDRDAALSYRRIEDFAVLEGYASRVKKAEFHFVLNADKFSVWNNVEDFWSDPTKYRTGRWETPMFTWVCEDFTPVRVTRA